MEIKNLSKILWEEMEKRGFNQQEMANFLGTSPGFLSQILRGIKKGERKYFQFLKKLEINPAEANETEQKLQPPPPPPPPQSHDPTGIDPVLYMLTQVAAKLDQVVAAIQDNGERRNEVVEAIKLTRTNNNLNSEKIIEAVLQAKDRLDESTQTILKAVIKNKPYNDGDTNQSGSHRKAGGERRMHKNAS